jgi:hypothetical protein
MPAATSTDALKELQTYQQSLQTPEAAMQAANKQYGVDSAQQNVQGLRGAIQRTTGLLQQVAPSVYGRTQNSLVTNAQATRQIGNEQAPIQQNLQNLGGQYSTASEDYRDLTGKAQSQAANTLQAQNGQLSFLQSIYQNLAGQEQVAKEEAYRQAQLAEQKRQFDASLAEQRAARAAASRASANPGLDLGGLASLMGGSGSAAASEAGGKPSLKGLTPTQAIERLFEGYQPGQHRGYTESVVIPQIRGIVAQVLPGRSDAEINKQTQNFVYSYRKKAFGE